MAVGPNRSVSDGSAAVLAAGVDGFVVYSASDDDPYLAVVQQRHLPVVVVDQPKDVPGTSRVCIDDRDAMRELAKHVVGLGHREIGLLTMRLGRDWPHSTRGLRWRTRSGSRHRTFTSSGSASTASTTR